MVYAMHVFCEILFCAMKYAYLYSRLQNYNFLCLQDCLSHSFLYVGYLLCWEILNMGQNDWFFFYAKSD